MGYDLIPNKMEEEAKIREGLDEKQLKELFLNNYFRYDSCTGGLDNAVHINIMITDNCNLNCNGCDHYSPVLKKRFVSKEVFADSIRILVKKIPQLNIISLWGGEALIHPDFIDLCKIARENFSGKINIGTNGVLLNSLSNEDLRILHEIKAEFLIANYPLEIDKNKFCAKLEDNGIHYALSKNRLHFFNHVINPLGTEDINQFYTCSKGLVPYLVLRDYKMYKCTPGFGIYECLKQLDINIELENFSDFLDIRELSNLQQFYNFCTSPCKNICKYCSESGGSRFNFSFWSNKDSGIENYLFTSKDNFLYNYEKYEKSIFNSYNIKYFLSDNKNNKNFSEDLSPYYLIRDLKRYSEDDKNIFCIYLKDIKEKDIEQIIKFSNYYKNKIIYILCDNIGIQLEEKIFDLFFGNLNNYCIPLKDNSEKTFSEKINKFANLIEKKGIYLFDKYDIYNLDFSQYYLFSELKNNLFISIKKNNIKYSLKEIICEMINVYSYLLKNKNILLNNFLFNIFDYIDIETYNQKDKDFLIAFNIFLCYNLFIIDNNFLNECNNDYYKEVILKRHFFIPIGNHVTYTYKTLKLKLLSLLQDYNRHWNEKIIFNFIKKGETKNE